MFWRIVFWVAVVEVVVCVLPIELTGVTAMIRFLFFGRRHLRWRGHAYSLLSNFRGIIGEDSDLRPLVFKEHDTAAVFGGENDSLANRPLIIAAFPLSIQYLPVIHSKHIVGRGMTDNRTPIPLLRKIVRK
jgi:hypothetical protein